MCIQLYLGTSIMDHFLAHIQSALKFTWVSNLDEVLLNAFDGGLKSVCKL